MRRTPRAPGVHRRPGPFARADGQEEAPCAWVRRLPATSSASLASRGCFGLAVYDEGEEEKPERQQERDETVVEYCAVHGDDESAAAVRHYSVEDWNRQIAAGKNLL